MIYPGGQFSYLPAQDYAGPDSFEYQVVDGTGRTATATPPLTTGAGSAARTAR